MVALFIARTLIDSHAAMALSTASWSTSLELDMMSNGDVIAAFSDSGSLGGLRAAVGTWRSSSLCPQY